MKNTLRRTASLVLMLSLLCGAALADSISFSGTVEASKTQAVYAPFGGTVAEVPVKAGQSVTADTVLARIETTKVYAEEDGVISSVFGQPGDSAETIAERYGAVMYLEGEYTLSISTSTSKAYADPDNDIIHSGETVYLVSRNHTNMKGEGFVTSVDGSSYTVLVSEGEFLVDDSVNIYRESSYSLASSLGRGSISRVSPTAVSGSGIIVSFAVQPGDTVKRGQLLFETVEGSFNSAEIKGSEILAGTDGVIASLSLEEGASVSQNGLVACIYPKDAVWVSAEVPEADLRELQVGQKVRVELDWNQEMGVSYEGTVEIISALGTVGEESTTYPVYVSFTPDENTRYSMTAVVTTLDNSRAADTNSDPEPVTVEEDVDLDADGE